MRFFPEITFFSLFNPKLHDAVRKLAIKLYNSIPMSFTTAQTIEVLEAAVAALQSGKEATAAALSAEKAALQRATEALALVEPLKASNSALQTLASKLQDSLDASTVRLAEWENQDAAEDAALEKLNAFLNPPADQGAPSDQPPADGPPSQPENPVPAGAEPDAPVPTADGVTLTESGSSQTPVDDFDKDDLNETL